MPHAFMSLQLGQKVFLTILMSVCMLSGNCAHVANDLFSCYVSVFCWNSSWTSDCSIMKQCCRFAWTFAMIVTHYKQHLTEAAFLLNEFTESITRFLIGLCITHEPHVSGCRLMAEMRSLSLNGFWFISNLNGGAEGKLCLDPPQTITKYKAT